MFTPAKSICVVAIVASTHFSLAAEQPTDRPSSAVVAPYLDEQTLLVAHLDLAAFDAPQTVDWLAELLDLPERVRDSLQAQAAPINVVIQHLAKDSSADVFIVGSLADAGRLPFFLLLPLDGKTPAAAIAGEARREIEKAWNRPLATEEVGGALVTASQETIDRLKRGKPADRPEVAAALTAAGGGAVQLAFVPPAALGKLVETILPQLPQSLGGGATKIFTQGGLWVAAGVDLPPEEIAIRVVVQSADAASALALQDELARFFTAVGKLPQVSEAVPEFGELSARLLPKAAGDQLKLELTEENGGVDALAAIVAPLSRVVVTAFAGR